MENSLKLLILAAGIIIVCVVVAIGIFITKSGKNQINSVQAQISQSINEFDNPNLQVYEGNTVSGTDVAQCVEKYASTSLKVTVKNLKDSAAKEYKTSGISASDVTVKSNGLYVGSIKRDANTDVINEIDFVQTK
jgi:predicted PurR-regulated permease PerM